MRYASNVISNVWTLGADGTVTVRIDTRVPAGDIEYQLMARLAELVEAYITARDTETPT